MIFTEMYLFQKRDEKKQTLDCVASTRSYLKFERVRNKAGRLRAYIGTGYKVRPNAHAVSDYKLSIGKEAISMLFELRSGVNLYTGDVKGMGDAFVVMHRDFARINGKISEGAKFAIVIARDLKRDRKILGEEVASGLFAAEIETLAKQLKPEQCYSDGWQMSEGEAAGIIKELNSQYKA